VPQGACSSAASACASRRPRNLGEDQGQQIEGGELGGKGLGRGNADFRTGAGNETQAVLAHQEDSGTLQMHSVRIMPSDLACCSAARVSAVSPDCEMVTTRVVRVGYRSR
jgi:hypothetical protein